MSSNAEPVSSPTDRRRRKQTIVLETHPELAVEELGNVKGNTKEISILTKATDNTTINDIVLDEELNTREARLLEHNFDKSDNSSNNDYKPVQKLEDNTSIVPQIQELTSNDTVYDDTKPKRLHSSKTLNMDPQNTVALRESINYLISPDDPDEESPKRRRRAHSRRENVDYDNSERVKPTFNENDISSVGQPRCEENSYGFYLDKGDELESSKQFYERSTERAMRKSSSPIQKLISKSEQSAAVVNNDRKYSSEARLLSVNDKMYNSVQAPPKRKISSDARLEHGYLDEQLKSSTRSRKVSFDTIAVINGNTHMPLNDEFCVPEENDLSGSESHGINVLNEIPAKENCVVHKQSLPRIFLTQGNDLEHNINDEDMLAKDASLDEDDAYASCCDNNAYVGDDEGSVEFSVNLETPSSFYLEANSANGTVGTKQLTQLATTPTEYVNATAVSNRVPNSGPKTMHKSFSVPTFVGRKQPSLEEYSPPKSILKVRRDDADSLASEDSTSQKSFTLRKDSIALFMDQKGDVVTMGELKEQRSRWRCFSTSDIKRAWTDRKMLLEKYKLHLLVLTLFLLTLAFVIVGLHFHSKHQRPSESSKNIVFDTKTRQISLANPQTLHKFTGRLGQSIPSWKQPTQCYSNHESIVDTNCLKWKDHGQLDIAYFVQKDIQCYNISWNLQSGTNLYDCFDIGNSYWYGPDNLSNSEWPIKNGFTFTVAEAKQYYSGTFSSIVDYYWLSSDGKAVVMDSNFSLEISWNKLQPNSFCIVGKTNEIDFEGKQTQSHVFQYKLCNGLSIEITHQFLRNKLISFLDKLPERAFLTSPQWSSASEVHADSDNVNETLVLDVVDLVSRHKLSCSSVEINGQWKSRFDEFFFNANLFQNVSDLVEKIHIAGCKVSLNIIPLFDFFDKLDRRYLERDSGKRDQGHIRGQYDTDATSDVSNLAADELFKTKIEGIATQYNITTFRLSYGTSSWMPHNPIFHLDDIDPNMMKQMISDLMSNLDNIVLESSSKGQHITTLVGIPSSVIVRGENVCLRNILPDIFTLGLLGYPFVMSDGFVTDTKSQNKNIILPSRDLFIRWMQLSSFLPAMRYTVKPWSYDSSVIELSQNLTHFHSQIILDAVFQAEADITAGIPIIKPLWWGRHEDKNTFTIDDEFMVADTFLVAPILCERNTESGMAERDIYVPKGVWRDIITGKVIVGPRLVQKYKVAQFQVPYFQQMLEYD